MTVVKWKIHTNKQSGEICWLYQVLNSIRQMIRIEAMIAAKNNKLNSHHNMWDEVNDYLT